MSTSRLRLVTNLVQAANHGISGVRRAPAVDAYPTQIATADLPYCLTWWGEGRAYQKGNGFKQEIRTFRIIVFVQPIGQNDAPTRSVAGADLLSAFQDYYITAANQAIGDPALTGGYQVTVHSGNDTEQVTDSGLVADLVFGGVAYAGFELRVPVRTLWGL